MTLAKKPKSSMDEPDMPIEQRRDVVEAPRLRILWLKTELLHPVDKGGKIRTYELLKRLKLLHQITYLTLDDGTVSDADRASAAEYCHELVCIPFAPARRFSVRFYSDLIFNAFSRLPYAIGRYRSPAFASALGDLAHSGNYDVIVCDFLVQAINLPSDMAIPVVLFQHNVEAMIWERHAEVGRNALARAYFKSQWRRMVAFEKHACRSLQTVIAVSDIDREAMERDYGVENVKVIPTGVDTAYFKPQNRSTVDQHTLVFTGSMDWMPNDDAIQYFIDAVLPKVRTAIPGAKLVVVGRNPGHRLCEAAASSPGIVVTGRVPDVRPYLEAAVCFVVPIRIGGGTRLKIFEAMAMEKAVVSTTIGAEGLPVTDGVDLLLADTPEAFATAIINLLSDPDRAASIGKQAAANVRANFGWDRVADQFSVLLCAAAGATPRTDPHASPHLYHPTLNV